VITLLKHHQQRIQQWEAEEDARKHMLQFLQVKILMEAFSCSISNIRFVIHDFSSKITVHARCKKGDEATKRNLMELVDLLERLLHASAPTGRGIHEKCKLKDKLKEITIRVGYNRSGERKGLDPFEA
jgi:hypothetical protein